MGRPSSRLYFQSRPVQPDLRCSIVIASRWIQVRRRRMVHVSETALKFEVAIRLVARVDRRCMTVNSSSMCGYSFLGESRGDGTPLAHLSQLDRSEQMDAAAGQWMSVRFAEGFTFNGAVCLGISERAQGGLQKPFLR